MIAALVLAAGLGRRMGDVKPLVDIRGRPTLARVLSTIDEAGIETTCVVLGASAGRIAAAVDLSRRHVVLNRSPERGMASSLALGLASLPAHVDGVLVFHADMPFLRADTVRAVMHLAADGAPIAAPRHLGVRGFPVFFRRSEFDELRTSLRGAGDHGGKEHILRHPERLRAVDVDDPGCLLDIDRPEDLPDAEEAACCATSE